jgi:hypothetical protein
MRGSVRRDGESSIGNPSALVNRTRPVTQTRSCSAHPSREFGFRRLFCELREMTSSRELLNQNVGVPLGPGRVLGRPVPLRKRSGHLNRCQVRARLIEGSLGSVEK